MRQLITICYALLLAGTLQAGEVVLQWDPSPTPEVTGYRLYYGPTSAEGLTPEQYISLPAVKSVDAGNVLIFKLTSLADGHYYFAVTAYAPGIDDPSVLMESDFSNVVSTTIAPPAFQITSLSASMRWFGVVLLCTTSVNSSAILRYRDLETGERQTVIATPDASKTQHRAVLYLNMGTQKYYRYEWTVTDADGNAITDGATFQIR